MNESQMFVQAKVFLEQGNYEQAVELLEQCIEANEENIDYYWYLGLAYLLQGQEENAQTTWLLVMSQGDEAEMIQWTQELLSILEAEAQRQEQIENLKLSWLIRGHIREIEPSLLNNLLHLIDLEIQLQSYEPEHLENWQLVDYFKDNLTEIIDSELLLKIIPNILDIPAFVNLDLLYACLTYIKDIDLLITQLKATAIKMAYERQLYNYAVELTNISLSLKPNDLVLIDEIFWFSAVAKNYPQMLKSAKDFLRQAETLPMKTFGYYKLIYTQIDRGAWSEALTVLPDYIAFLQKMLASRPESIERIMRGGIQGMATPLLYTQDNPLFSRSLQNQLAALFQKFLPSWVPWSRDIKKVNCHYPRVLKIGYIAHTLRRHSVGWLSRWLLHHYDREQFQTSLYLISQKEDDITQTWFREKVDFTYNFPHAPQKIADQIQQDEIDILVDLDSFSNGVTCQVLALKPAPIQVTWLGFDASGLPSIDYFIVDPYVLPDNAQDYYQERIWRLPQTYLAVDGFEVAVPDLKREDLGISHDAIIYLTVQTAEKRHPDTMRLQMQVLQAVPNSYLLIKGRADRTVIQPLFAGIAQEHGITPDRLRFLDQSPSEEVHRANLAIADVILDTYPYNGATTTLEALWMGIPLVTKVGKQFAARNSYTFMTNAGLTEGIAWTDEEYINWGIRLGKDDNLRTQISWKLGQSRKTAPLWNAKQFTKEMEKAYQQMWQKYLDA